MVRLRIDSDAAAGDVYEILGHWQQWFLADRFHLVFHVIGRYISVNAGADTGADTGASVNTSAGAVDTTVGAGFTDVIAADEVQTTVSIPVDSVHN